MTRKERIARQLRRARKINDRTAIAILEGGRTFSDVDVDDRYTTLRFPRWARPSESEMRALWGDR